MANLPSLPDANVWGLLNLKAGKKTKQSKLLKKLQRDSVRLEAPNVVKDERKARRLQFNLNRRHLDLWKGPVHQNRLADQLIFPLRDKDIQFSTSKQSIEEKRLREISSAKSDTSDIRGKLFSALYKDTTIKKSRNQLDEEEQIELAKKMSAKVADQMRKRLREVSLLHKTKIQRRIKSKNYHRRMKRRSMKEFEKDIVLLRQNNPKAFAERLLEADLSRARERASLRHKKGGKFARLQRIRAKYDTEAREAVAQMRDHGADLTRRRMRDDDVDEDADSDALSVADLSSSEEEVDEGSDSEVSDSERVKESTDMAPHLVDWWAQLENKKGSTISTSSSLERVKDNPVLSTLASDKLLDKSQPMDTSESHRKPDASETASANIDFDPTDDHFFSALQEACGEDVDLAKEFSEEKEEVTTEEAPKDLDPFMPGWNRWTGPGMEAAEEEIRQKLLIKAPSRKRVDAKKSKVIIRHRVNADLKKHLVKQIPFPYSNPAQFEAFIDQPVSREWTTESAHKELTKPKVILISGQVIRPIKKSSVLLREKDTLRLTKGTRHI